jgi:hypothetical protein
MATKRRKARKVPAGCKIVRRKGRYQYSGANCKKAGKFAPAPKGKDKTTKRRSTKGKKRPGRCLKWSKGRTRCLKRAKR